MVMEPQAPGPVTSSSSSSSRIVTDTPMNQLPSLDHSSMSMQSSPAAVPSAPPSKVAVHQDPATGTTSKPNSHTLGCEFVRQYYTMLNRAPSSVHRFYAEDSSFIHGSLNDSVQSKPVYGHQEINDRIMALNFKDCHAKIVQVDSLETVDQGFVIQVTGELSNNGQPMRRFFQTFVLVPRSPNNYYVRNDIFRYQDEVFADEEEVSEAEESEVTRSSAPTSSSTAVASSATGPVTSIASNVNTTSLATQQERQGENSVEKGKGPHKVNGFQEQKSPTGALEASEQPQQQQQATTQQPQNNKSSPAGAATATTTSAAATTTGVAATGTTAVTSSSVPSVPQSEKAPVSSWAAKVARDAMKPPSDVSLTSVTSNVTSTSTLAPSPKASKEQQQNTSPAGHHPHHQQQHQQQQQQHQPGRKGDRGAKAARVERDDSNAINEGGEGGTGNENHEVIKKVSPYNDDQQVFVGNLPLDIKEEDLKNFFGKFGNILDVRINRTNQTSGSGRTPNYGFVTFDDAKVVRTILSQKPIYFNEHRFNVEEKRSQGRGSALNRSGSGATLGVNKGANQQQQQQQNSQQTRRERRDRFPFQGNRETGPRRNQTGGGAAGAPGITGQGRPVFQPKR